MSRKFFIGFGIFFAIFGGISVAAGWSSDNGAGTGSITLALAFILFVNAYLFPQIRENDERIRDIRQKSFFYSYFFSIGYILLFGALASENVLPFTTYEALTWLTVLMVLTPAIILIILAKRY